MGKCGPKPPLGRWLGSSVLALWVAPSSFPDRQGCCLRVVWLCGCARLDALRGLTASGADFCCSVLCVLCWAPLLSFFLSTL